MNIKHRKIMAADEFDEFENFNDEEAAVNDQLDDIQDQSMIIEFPDYVVYEIINTLVKLILENGGNPRIQTHMGVNQSIV